MGIIKGISKIFGKITPSDVKLATGKLSGAMKRGYQIGKRCNSIHNVGRVRGLKTSAKSVTRELKKLKFTRDEVPALAASITYMIPIPSPVPLTPIVYGLGHGINKGAKLAGKLKNSIFR